MGDAAAPSCLSAEAGRLAGRFCGCLQMAEEQWEREAVGPDLSSERELPGFGLGDIGSLSFKLFLCLPHSWLFAWRLPMPLPALALPTSF